MKKISEKCSFSSENGDWNFLNRVIKMENHFFPITNNNPNSDLNKHIVDNDDIDVINNSQIYINQQINESLLIYVLTWNLHGKIPELDELKKILSLTTKENSIQNSYQKSRKFDLFVINTQECLRSIGASFFNSSKEDWINVLSEVFGDDYINLVNSTLNSFHIAVFVNKEKIQFFTDLKTGFIKTGFMNILGNKGAIGVSMKYMSKSLLFVCCHLSSGQSNIDARNNDFKRISIGLNLKPTFEFNKKLKDLKINTNNKFENSDIGKQKFIASNISAMSNQTGKGNNTLKNNFMKDVHLRQFTRNSIEKITYNRKQLTDGNIDDDLDLKNKKNKKKMKNSESDDAETNTNKDIGAPITQQVKNPQSLNDNKKNFINDNAVFIGSCNNNESVGEGKQSQNNLEFILFKGDNVPYISSTGNKKCEVKNDIINDKKEDIEEKLEMNQYDLVIFSGDLNYRINMEIKDIQKHIKNNDYETLLEKDQLYHSLIKKELDLDDFFEGHITFMPTYKFIDGTNEYDFEERVPGWTDRILYRANNLNDVIQCKYSSIRDVVLSDHKPVYAVFKINFNNDENKEKKYQRIEKGCLII